MEKVTVNCNGAIIDICDKPRKLLGTIFTLITFHLNYTSLETVKEACKAKGVDEEKMEELIEKLENL